MSSQRKASDPTGDSAEAAAESRHELVPTSGPKDALPARVGATTLEPPPAPPSLPPVSVQVVRESPVYAHSPWWRSRAAFAIACLTVLAGFLLWLVIYQPMRAARDAGGELTGAVETVYTDLKDATKEAIATLGTWSQPQMHSSFTSYVQKLEGIGRLEVARQQGWVMNKVTLHKWPWADATVEARAPVHSTYVIDLNPSAWSITPSDDGKTIRVVAPPIHANEPAIAVDRIDTYAMETSWRISENALVDEARAGLYPKAMREAMRRIPEDVRPKAREAVESFVSNWVLAAAPQGMSKPRIEVRFADESPTTPLSPSDGM